MARHESLLDKVAGLFFSKEQHTERIAHRRAIEVLSLFTQGDQEPIVSYYDNASTQFDVARLNPGAIFRINLVSDDVKVKIYYHYALGQVDDSGIYLYAVDRENVFDPKLHMEPGGFTLRRATLNRLQFPVVWAKHALGRSTLTPDEDWIVPSQIDMMAGGTKVTVKSVPVHADGVGMVSVLDGRVPA